MTRWRFSITTAATLLLISLMAVGQEASSRAKPVANKPKAGDAKPAESKSAESKSSEQKPADAAKSRAAKHLPMPGVTPAREAAVMTFVERHHPELKQLLVHLREHRPKEYERAVRDLFRASERLAQIQERDVERYELELQAWQLKSRIELLTARLRMSKSDDLLKQLRTLLEQEVDIRMAVLERERQRTASRADRLQEQLRELKARRQTTVEQRFQELLPSSPPPTQPTSVSVEN